MIEAWFQTQGLPAKVELSQNNNQRLFVGMLIYLVVYAFETFIGVQCAATGTGLPLIIMQTISGVCWVVAVCLLQVTRGQGKRYIYLNRLATAEYRCFQLITSGKHVHSAIISTQLSNVREYNLFGSKYECKQLKIVGGAMVASGMIDIFATVLLVGLNEWAYGWLAIQVFLIVIKVIFSLEPIRRIPIVDVQPLVGDSLDQGPQLTATSSRQGLNTKARLPIIVDSSPDFSFKEVCVTQNVVLETSTGAYWLSRTPGLFIGQPYYMERPRLAEKPTASSMDSMPMLPQLHVSPPSSERGTTNVEKHGVQASDPAMFPLPPSPSIGRCASPTSSESESTIMPSPATTRVVTEVPRIIVSPESPLVASPPNSPTSLSPPPGIPVTRTASIRSASTQAPSTRAPTPPAKPLSRSATRGPPPVSIVTRNTSLVSSPRPIRPARPQPRRSQSDTLVTPPALPTTPPASKEKQESVSTTASPEPVRYLALSKDGKLTLSETEPQHETNQALQREFLACVAEVVRANKVPSTEFLLAVEAMCQGVRKTMSDNWYAFGTTDLLRYLRAAYTDVLWRRFV
ncbi:hypothetical protein C8Q76DRAFT_742703 [Earliella scabrosa]|nr:hypothetical protein C8Q76DRAFT_742703 [Earliella scabrosa]